MRRKLSYEPKDTRLVMWSTALVITTIFFILLPGAYGSEMSKRSSPLQLDMPCLNGGVGFGGECMCPHSVTGARCETDACSSQVGRHFKMSNPFNHAERNVSLDTCDMAPQLICCWRNRLAQVTPKDGSDRDSRIKNLLEFYGPWTDNDRLMLDYFFGDEGTEGKYIASAPTTPPESPLEELTLAFVLLVHSDFQSRLPNLLDAIYSKRHTYMIHVDKSTDSNNWEWINTFVTQYNHKHQANNVHLVEHRFHGAWGHVSLVYLELAAIIELLRIGDANGGSKWTHVINLSAYDFPLKPINRIEKFLHAHKHNNFIEILGQKLRREMRQSDLHVSCGRSIFITNFTENPVCPTGASNWMFRHKPSWVYGEGSQWKILTREFLEYLVSSLDQIELLFSLKYTLVPDESFFQSAILSSPFAPTVNRYNYRYLPWADQLEVMPKHVKLLRETDAFFVRKLLDPDMGPILVKDVIAHYL